MVGEYLTELVQSVSPHLLELLEEALGLGDRLHVAVYELLATPFLLGDQQGPLENRNVLLNSGKAHGVAAGKLGYRVLAVHRSPEDVPPGGVGQSVEQAICPLLIFQKIYNHSVVGLPQLRASGKHKCQAAPFG